MQRRRLVRVPASSANLGPGFDAFAAALALHVELEVVETGRFAVETRLDIARDRRNLAVRGFARLLKPDNFTFRIRSQVPLSGGLGSSAAAYVAGLTAAAHILELDEDLLAHATELEGHPDNAAAALLGGFVIVAGGEVARFDPPDGLEALIVVPRTAVRTAVARRALPASVPLSDAAANVGYGAVLTLGLATGDLSLIGRGLHDRLHQPYRARGDRRDDLRRRPDGPVLDAHRRDGSGRRHPAPRDRRLGRGPASAVRDAGGGRPRVVRGGYFVKPMSS
jgi:homoserine kinase